MNEANELVKNIYEYIGEPVDYAELIGSPVPSTYGICYTYEDPGDILLAQAAKMLLEQQRKIYELNAQILRKPIPVYKECISAGYACRGMTKTEVPNIYVMCAKWEYGNGYMDYNLGCDVPTYRCSNCKCEEELTTDYCPNCGAKMDLGDELL